VSTRPEPLAYTDCGGAAFLVWDVVDGRRTTPREEHGAAQRVFVSAADRTAFACTLTRRLGPWPLDESSLRFQLSHAREAGPLPRPGEAEADHQARCTAEPRIPRGATGGAGAALGGDGTPPVPGAVPTCDDDRRRGAPAHPNPD
jgi:hypothetical protein